VKSNFVCARVALAIASVLALGVLSAAATSPLNSPQGLAVAQNGDLYVANTGGNNILVYGPAHAQLAAQTIEVGISGPTAVALDPNGNVWVANAGNNSITEYSPTGVPSKNTITSGVSNPEAIAFDGIADLWVNNGFETLTMYAAFGQVPVQTLPGAPTGESGQYIQPLTAIASFGEFIFFGNNSSTTKTTLYPLLAGFTGPAGSLDAACYAAAFDGVGNLYCANQDGSLEIFYAAGEYGPSKQLVANVGFFPFGIALDKTRGFIYVSSAVNNEIAVYNTSGKLLTTIHN
jgi:DNA-binding beta-propeller fold protein YncE